VIVAVLAEREHQPDPLRQQPARDERERLRRHAIEPLRIVHDAHQRLLLGHVGEQAQHSQTHHEPIRWRPGSQPERRGQRVPLRGWKVR
jgi:hypothetical protein